MKYLCVFKFPLILVLALALRGAEALGAELDAISKKPSPTRGESPALTLGRAIGLALENNLELQAAAGRIQAAAGRADQAGRWPNPDLELSSEDWPVNRGGISQAQNMIGASQTVPFPGKKRLEHQIGAAAVRATESELDLIRALRMGKPLEHVSVTDIMTRDVVTVDVSTPVEDIMTIFECEHILRVPVMREGKIVGIVSRPDLLRAIVEPNFIRIG